MYKRQVLYGQDGNDTLNGGTGNDALYGQDGNDTLNGDAGADELFGADGDDVINGGDGDDLIHGDFGGSSAVSTVGWNYEYYDYTSSTNATNLASAGFTLNGGRDNSFTVTSSGITSDLNPATIDSGDYYSIKYSAILTINTAGTYTFRTASDDGSALFLDGVQIVDNDGLHGTVTVTSAGQSLAAGTYLLEATYFERTGGNTMNVLMSGPDTGGSYVGLGSYGDIEPVTPPAPVAGGDDIIMDFSTPDLDILDISDLLTNWQTGHSIRGDISNYLSFIDSGADTIVQVDANGQSGGTGFQTIATFEGVTGLDETILYANSQVIVE